jgi:ethanolamine ammonia-lyase small subunit
MKHTLPDLPAQWDDPDDVPALPSRTQAKPTPADPWTALRRHTPARISLGRAGTSLPTSEVLRFAAAHARARDAVHLPLDVAALATDLGGLGLACAFASSRAATRAEYLARPDLGRQLAQASRAALEAQASTAAGAPALCIVIGDGLSAVAAQMHAAPLVAALKEALQAPGGEAIAVDGVVVATQARVALGDEIGALLGSPLVLMLLGERPGLSSPDSLGAYLTWAPRAGRADSERNCVSNIRPEGLPLAAAAARIAWLVRESSRRRVSGLALKDDSEVLALDGREGMDRLEGGR